MCENKSHFAIRNDAPVEENKWVTVVWCNRLGRSNDLAENVYAFISLDRVCFLSSREMLQDDAVISHCQDLYEDGPCYSTIIWSSRW